MKFETEYFKSAYRDYINQNPPRKLRAYLKKMNAYAPPTATKLLDVGCAFGYFLKVASSDYRVYGVDPSSYATEFARRLVPEAQIVTETIEDLNFSEKMDIITVFDVVEHVENIGKAFSVLKEQLADDGIIVFVIPVYDGIAGKVASILDKDPTHIHKCSRKWWLDRIREDFDIIDWFGIFRYLMPFGFYFHILYRCLRTSSQAIMVVAKNPPSVCKTT